MNESTNVQLVICHALRSIILYCISLYFSPLYFILLYFILFHCILLYCILLYCFVFYCIVFYCIWFNVFLCRIIFYYIVFFCIVISYIVLRYILKYYYIIKKTKLTFIWFLSIHLYSMQEGKVIKSLLTAHIKILQRCVLFLEIHQQFIVQLAYLT